MRILIVTAGLAVVLGAAVLGWSYRGQFIGDFSLGVASSTFSAFALAAWSIVRAWQREATYTKVRILAFLHPRRQLRLSAAYLYRFEIENDFLLIRNLAHGSVSPIGGVYKYFNSARALLDELHMVQALGTTLQLPDKFDRDIRIAVELRYARRLLDWLRSGTGREYCPDREFREELNDSGLLPEQVSFAGVECSKFSTETFLSGYDHSAAWYNLHYLDIFCVKLTREQIGIVKAALRREEAVAKGDPNRQRLFLATADEIRRGRLHNGQHLGEYTRCIL